jgi:hypothetical protein
MTTNTITEADVVAFLTDISKHAAAEFGGYGFARLEVMAHANGNCYETAQLGAGGLCTLHSGKTFAEALIAARRESPAVVAAKKRAEAARLLAEADNLEGKS